MKNESLRSKIFFFFFNGQVISYIPNLSNRVTILADEAVNLTSESYDTITRMNYLRKRKKEREDLTESTGVVPAKYPPKVKLELFSQL